MKKLTLFVVAMAVLSGCRASAPQAQLSIGFHEIGEDSEKEYSLVVKGENVQLLQITQINDSVQYLPQPILEHLPSFTICRDEAHLQAGRDKAVILIAGHCHDDGRVCLRYDALIYSVVVWHESLHAFDYYRASTGHSPIPKWQKIAGPVYLDDKQENKPRPYAPDGLLSDYCRVSAWEDRAVFFAECLSYLRWRTSYVGALSGNGFLKSDQRYRQKLDALKDDGLFTDEQYEILKPLFE